MSTKHKTEIRQHDDTLTTIITKASNVLYEDGTTAQDKLDDRNDSMFTQSIENSSSMFKIGQGNNVDFSANVESGAYENAILKGKTMVNLIQEPSSKDVVLPYEFADGHYVTINDTKESGALGVELKGQTLVNIVTLDTTKEYVLEQDGSSIKNVKFNLIDGFENDIYTITLEMSNVNIVNPNKDWVVYIHTPSEIDGGADNTTIKSFIKNGRVSFTYKPSRGLKTKNWFNISLHTDSGVGSTITIKNVMVLKGDHTQEDIPYFEGMTSVKSPVIKTVGKNLFDEQVANNRDVNINTGETMDTGNRTVPINFIPVKPNTTYSFTRPVATGNVGFRYYSQNQTFIKSQAFTGSNSLLSVTFATPSDCYFLKFIDEANTTTKGYQLEESSSATLYESCKTSILSLPEEVVLRKIRNVYETIEDTLSCSTGIMKSYVNELTLNGSEDWNLYRDRESNTIAFMFHAPHGRMHQIGVMSCDKVPVYTQNEALKLEDKEWCFYNDHGSPIVFINVLRSKLTSPDVAGFKTWLRENNVKIQYPRETPIVTKINLPSTLKSWNTTTHIYSEIPENTLYPILSHSNPSYPVILKPSTKYSIVANSYSNEHTNSAINFNLGGATTSTTVGNRVTAITTPNTLSNELLTMSGRGNKLNNVMVIEGDVVGDEPYFEGMCDVKSPILSNCGKNLFDEQRHSNPDNFFVHSAYWSIPIRLKGNTEYRFSYTFNNVLDKQVVMRFATCKWTSTDHSTYPYSLGEVFNKNITSNLMGKTESMSFVTPTDGLVYLHYYNTELTNSPSSFSLASWYTHILKDIQLEESSTSTQCEPYKSNTTTFDQKDGKTIVLRSLPNGVCDTLNVETGEYIQRIGEVVLKGSEGWTLDSANPNNTYVGFYAPHEVSKGYSIVISNKLPTITSEQWKNKSLCGIYKGGSALGFVTERSNLTSIDYKGFNSWLSQNPVTVQYELETPVVKTVDVQGFPYAYEDGHVQLSSAHNGSSLTPKVEYSVVTNRNGQIRSNQRMVERHEKKLNQLQEMILVNVIDTQYRQTLTSLNYELSKVGEKYDL